MAMSPAPMSVFESPEPRIEDSCDNCACWRSNVKDRLDGGPVVLRLVLLLISMFAVTAWSQDSKTDSDTDTIETPQEQIEDEEQDDPDLDEDNYLDAEEDDFRPSETVSADQSIAFPTDI